jgi:protein-L-isoaspartate(D-aspartate) O-methyltransferase
VTGRPEKRRGLTPEFYRAKLVRRLAAMGITDERVLDAIGRVPRHAFVDEAWDLRKAYEDTALPIGRAQTISQPYVVALMTQAVLNGRKLGHVLEVGTGCGYQTAVLAEIVERVYSVERIKALYLSASERLRKLNYLRVYLSHMDGYNGWQQQAPFDGIVVTAAAEQVPLALLKQLAPGGHLVIPLGPAGDQKLCRFTRAVSGSVGQETLAAVSFVPMLPATQD